MVAGRAKRAQKVRPPAVSGRLARELAGREGERRRVLALERASIVRGLLLLAVVVLLASILRAGMGRAFVPHWWREW